ncbi:hypothetical protein FCL40_02040 [Ferrimonas sediminicola]|uniref:Uncharacterized protein n=1 Tax=Ferrimonas sediminicola TaxID=2569538 RepID=A0A4V5NVP8_9GAMM|nr:hypothetical protein [Ferrimonas sediminicola]TKB51361.1 hypothetical protein FCL40_02040 [Ferrimonas sediminicola]
MRTMILSMVLLAGCQAPISDEDAQSIQMRMAAQSAAEQEAAGRGGDLGVWQSRGSRCVIGGGRSCTMLGELSVGSPCRCDEQEGVVK